MRIAHVIHSLEVGGLENGVVNLLNSLRDGFSHDVVCIGDVGAFRARLRDEVEVLALGKGQARDLWAMLRLVRTFRRIRPDIVHSRNWAAIEAIPAAWLAGVPAIIHGEHGREADDPQGRDARRNRMRRLLAGLVDRFLTVSGDLRQWLVGAVGIPERKVATIPNGVDTARFSDQDREQGRHALGMDEGRLVIGTVGRLDPVKDHAGLIRAFARIAHERADVVLVIVGPGPTRQELEGLTATLGLQGRVQLVGERNDIPLLLKGFDVFVLSSIAEGMSNTILEAMATGLPVVATRVGGNPELVEEGVNGRLVPPRDPLALAAALGTYLGDPLLRTLHGKASRQRAVERFSLDRMVTSYRDLYASLAQEAGIP